MSKQFDQEAFATKSIIHVGGLHPFTTADNLQNVFITFGQINKVSVPLDEGHEIEKALGVKLDYQDGLGEKNNEHNPAEPKQQRNKGFGLIEFEDPEDAKHAVANMNDAELFGMTLKVSIAQSNAQKGKMKWDVVDTKTASAANNMGDWFLNLDFRFACFGDGGGWGGRELEAGGVGFWTLERSSPFNPIHLPTHQPNIFPVPNNDRYISWLSGILGTGAILRAGRGIGICYWTNNMVMIIFSY